MFRCHQCNDMVETMWGATCNNCRRENQEHKDILKSVCTKDKYEALQAKYDALELAYKDKADEMNDLELELQELKFKYDSLKEKSEKLRELLSTFNNDMFTDSQLKEIAECDEETKK